MSPPERVEADGGNGSGDDEAGGNGEEVKGVDTDRDGSAERLREGKNDGVMEKAGVKDGTDDEV